MCVFLFFFFGVDGRVAPGGGAVAMAKVLRWPRLPFPSSTKNGVKGGRGCARRATRFLFFSRAYSYVCVYEVSLVFRDFTSHVVKHFHGDTSTYWYVRSSPTAGGRAISLGVGGATPSPPSVSLWVFAFLLRNWRGRDLPRVLPTLVYVFGFWVWLLFREYKKRAGGDVAWRGGPVFV